MNDDLVEAALVEGAPYQRQMGIVEGIERTEVEADAALGRQHRAEIGQQADAEQDRAEAEAQDQEGLSRHGNTRRAERCQDNVDREAGQHVAVGVADAASDQVQAEILGALRGERSEECG